MKQTNLRLDILQRADSCVLDERNFIYSDDEKRVLFRARGGKPGKLSKSYRKWTDYAFWDPQIIYHTIWFVT